MTDTEPKGIAIDFLVGQTKVLESIAAGEPLENTLSQLARLIQRQLPGSRCLVMRLSNDGKHLRFEAAPDLPDAVAIRADGTPVGPLHGTCAHAAWTGRLHVTHDIEVDEHWEEERRAFARENGIRACWSVPILNAEKKVMGTFAITHPHPTGQPTAADLEALQLASRLASIAIERHRQAETLAAGERKWHAIFDHSSDAIIILDDERRYADVNRAACEMFGLTRDEIVGRGINDLIQPEEPPGGLPPAAERWAHFLREGQDAKSCIVQRPDGTIRYADFHAKAHYQPGFHLCNARDVTEQRLAEDSLQKTQKLYESLIETTGTGYLVSDETGNVLDANAEYVHLTGRDSLDKVLGRHLAEWVAPHDRPRFRAEMTRLLSSGSLRDVEVDFIHPDGQTVPVEVNITVVPTDEGTRLLALCHDITGRLQTRRELQNARCELESRVESRTAELARANERIRSRARQQEAVAELGRLALAGTSVEALMQQAAESLVAVLDLDFASVLEHLDPESSDLVLKGRAGRHPREIGQVVADTDPAGMVGYALRQPGPVTYEDLATETRFRRSTLFLAIGVQSGIVVQIPGDPHPFGLLSGQSRRRRRFTPDDAFFLQSMANVLATAIGRIRSEKALLLAQQSAVQANNAKLDFLSRMSHELRTPLNAILGFSQLLEIEPLQGGQRESVEQITRAGRHLLELVNEVLDISRIDSGNIALAPEPLAVEELLREALDLIRPLADQQKVQLVPGAGCQVPDCFVLADRQRVRQVLLNLLSNAVKYNRPEGSVTLDGSPTSDGCHIRLTVKDTGVGIKPEYLSRLYTPFERLGAENTEVEGSGMGLALSKRLVESQGGQLGVETKPGVGTTFYVDLPVAAAPEQDDSARFECLINESFFAMEPRDPVPEPTSRRTVLHIEDNEPNRMLIEMLVAQRPAIRLLTASRGNEGLKLAREHHPDLILLDLHLPDTSGDQVLNNLRSEDGTRDTPVVMVSADATAIRRSQAYENGANEFLTKPFNVGQFLKVLDNYLGAAA